MIPVRYIPTFNDYWALNRLNLLKLTRGLHWLAALVFCGYLVSPFGLHSGAQTLSERYLTNSGLLILPGIVVIMWLTTYWGAKGRWTAAAELREEKLYEIDDTGIRVKGESFTGFNEWRLIKNAAITPKFVYLMTAQRQYFYFPTQAVPDLSQLKSLLQQKVPGFK